MSPNDADGMANSEDPDQSDLGLHCLPRHTCPKTLDHYGIQNCKNLQLRIDLPLTW